MSLAASPALPHRGAAAWSPLSWLIALCLILSLTPGCRPDDDDGDEVDGGDAEEESVDPIPKRPGTLVVDGCSLDSGQQATLRSAEARQVVSEVVLVCLSLTSRGGVSLRQAQSDSGLKGLLGELRGLGYAVHLGITAVDEDDDEQSADELSRWLKQGLWRQGTVRALAPYASDSDGLQVMLPELEDQARADLTSWISALSARVRPQRRLDLFVPPSLRQPSDIAGGEAYDLAALVSKVDRVRVLTLDAASGEAPGPTLDAEWTRQAASFAAMTTGTGKLDVAVPLYGINFRMQTTPTRQIAEETHVSFAEAKALAVMYGVTPQGGDGEALHFSYKDASGDEHEVWYEDSASILQGLRELPLTSLPQSVGVVYFSLGGEDPDVFADLAEAMADMPAS